MIKNYEVFSVDPRGRRLANDGVAVLDMPTSPAEWRILKQELEQFVAEGTYKEGLRRVLGSYLTNLESDMQPAVWVSGFYGSGKSHFMRVLFYLWSNPVIEGQTARSLVNPPVDIADQLKELDTAAKRLRTITFAAAGIMRRTQGSHLAPILEIVLGAAGLPSQYAPAKFTLWLKEEGRWEAFLEALHTHGKDESEVAENLFVSPAVRQSLIRAIPGWASTPAQAGEQIAANFQVRDVSDEMLIETVRQVLSMVARESTYGDRATTPQTLIVLDELQQYIGDDVQLLADIQDAIQQLQRRFEGRLLVVAAGQSALAANEVLARFQDRFTVRVQLESKDVETVVRQVVLRKKPEYVEEIRAELDAVSGEVARHLAGTKLAAQPADSAFAVQDYPLLPTRRRFMEKALRAVDRGAAGQLRSQLRVIMGAVAERDEKRSSKPSLADLPLGNVIPADFVYRAKEPDMINQGVILHEVRDRIAALDDGTANGELKARAVQLVFLIDHLDEADGVRPTIDTLADLMVTDLNAGSAELRAKLPGLLDSVELLVREDDEYRLLSDVDREWNLAFVAKRQALQIDTSEQVHRRAEAMEARFVEETGVIKVLQGVTRTARKWSASIGEAKPEEDEAGLTVWVRSGWDQTEVNVRATATEMGMDSPVVTLFIPKVNDQDFKNAIAEWRAAAHVVATQPPPATEAGQQAKDAMEARRKRAEGRVRRLAEDAVARAQVYLAGGELVAGAGGLQSGLTEALEKAAVRKFPKFKEADNNAWPTVFTRAKDGNMDAIRAVGYTGDLEQHPVVRGVLSQLPLAGSPDPAPSGGAVLKNLSASPYGWSRDAVFGALAALVRAEVVVAVEGGRTYSASDLTLPMMTKPTFRRAGAVLTFAQKQKLKQLGARMGRPLGTYDVPVSLGLLKAEAAKAGGPPPLPAPPSVAGLDAMLLGEGPERDARVADQVDDLLEQLDGWQEVAERIPGRQAEWAEAQQLLHAARHLPGHSSAATTMEAITNNRSLLEDPNPLLDVVPGLLAEVRAAMQAAHEEAVKAHGEAIAQIEQNPHWVQLDAPEQARFIQANGLNPPEPLEVADKVGLIRALETQSLDARAQIAPAILGRAIRAADGLNKRFAPKAIQVRIPGQTISSQAELDDYLEVIRGKVKSHLANGDQVNVN